MTTHDLKVWPEYFAAILDGSKPFEVRKDDRGYAVGDVLLLREYDPDVFEREFGRLQLVEVDMDVAYHGAAGAAYTGRAVCRRVTYVLRGGPWLHEGYVVLGLSRDEEPPVFDAAAAFQELREAANGAFDGVDVEAYMRELRED